MMLTLECYWYEADHPVDPKQRKTYTSDDVEKLLQQAFLEKMAHKDWVGYRIVDGLTHIVYQQFTRDVQVKNRWTGQTKSL